MSQGQGDMKKNSTASDFDPLLDGLQNRAFKYFLEHLDPVTGLVADSTAAEAPSSIAAVGMALGVFPIIAEVLPGFLCPMPGVAEVSRSRTG